MAEDSVSEYHAHRPSIIEIMSKVDEDLQWENSRDESPISKATINLCLSGGFWRAYNRSECLLLNLTRKMKVHVDMCGEEKVAWVVFPVSSGSNWLPSKYVFESKDDNRASFKPMYDLSLPDIDVFQPSYEKWYASLVITPRSKRRQVNKSHDGNLMLESDDVEKIVLQIMAFPIEMKSPLECIEFISELKIKFASILSNRLSAQTTTNESICSE